MFSYSDIIKRAYYITRNFPVLWFFGLFVVGGFSLNFLHFQDIPLRSIVSQPFPAHNLFMYFGTHPISLATLSFSLLIFSIAGLLLTNWCRIMLVLLTRELHEKKHANLQEQIKASPKPLWPVIKVSLLTSVMLLAVATALLGVPLWSHMDLSIKIILWSIGSVVFVPLAFTISCINIFTTFFLVLNKQPWKQALNLGTDFFLVNWNKILALGFVLTVIFLAGSAVGGAIIFLAKILGNLLQLSPLGFSAVSATIIVIKTLAVAFLWLILAILNVFFNTSLLLLFFKLVTPTKEEERVSGLPVYSAAP